MYFGGTEGWGGERQKTSKKIEQCELMQSPAKYRVPRYSRGMAFTMTVEGSGIDWVDSRCSCQNKGESQKKNMTRKRPLLLCKV